MIKRILICEDTEQVVIALRAQLERLSASVGDEFKIDVIMTQAGAKQLSSQLDGDDYDLVLLDYFAPDGDFHVLDFEKIGCEKVIAMSSIAGYNQRALNRGVVCAVTKNNPLTDDKAAQIVEKAEHILYDSSPQSPLPSHNFDKIASS